jgi:hypothetical protein
LEGEASLEGMCYLSAVFLITFKVMKSWTHLLEELVENSRLSDLEITRLNTSVVNTENHVDIFHRLCSDIGKFLDLGSCILDLFVVEREVELLDSGLDGVPTG